MLADRETCGCPRGTIHVPVIAPEPPCGHRGVDNTPCTRQADHTGRHAFIWQHCGRVRSVWDEAA